MRSGTPIRNPRVGVVARAYQPAKPTLLDRPLSPFGARARYVIYSQGLEGDVDIETPDVLGGAKTPQYMQLHPAGKFPLLVLPSGQGVPESAVITDYLIEKFAGAAHLMPSTPEERAAVRTIVHIMDVYFTPVMGCMYKPMEVGERARQIAEVARILDHLETLCQGPFIAGGRISAADAAVFPLFVFMTFMLPRFFGWGSVFEGRPRLAAWWQKIHEDVHATRVIAEIQAGLEDWEASGRWAKNGINEQVASGTHVWAGADIGQATAAV